MAACLCCGGYCCVSLRNVAEVYLTWSIIGYPFNSFVVQSTNPLVCSVSFSIKLIDL